MTNEQPIEAFKATAEVTAEYADRILIPDVGCVDSRPTLELAKAGDEIRVDGIAAVPPF
jgi:dihydrodipicolinate synthase/N-acetylneuraminate lyase